MNTFDFFIIIDFITAIIIYFYYLYPRWNSNQKELFLKSAAYIYLTFVIYFTLMPILIPIPFINTNISSWELNTIPFYDFIYNHSGAQKEFILNIVMMIPFGILIPFVYKKGFVKTVIYTFIFSFLIESFQFISVRQINSCDITDLISNTIGGIIGYVIYLIFGRLVNKILDKIFKNNYSRKNIERRKLIIVIIIIELMIRSIFIMF